MEHKRRNLIVLAVVIILVLFLIWILWPSVKTNDVRPIVGGQTEMTETVETSLIAPLVVREDSTPTQAGAEAVARSFAERFASFSYESDFANVTDLYPLMTDAYKTRQESFIKSTAASDEYYGVSSKLISLDVVEMNDSRAIMDAHMQRTESKGSVVNVTKKYETLRLNLVFENETWLIDGANWLK
jgi:hypothetical protein